MDNNTSGKKPRSEKLALEAQKQRKTLVIMLCVASLLVGLGVYSHLNSDQSNKSTEAFFEARKSPEKYYEYKQAEESAKKKAERNIFLQN
jgi:hypothetical protein